MNNENLVIDQIIDNITKVIMGKRPVITDIIKGIIAEGHILIEDVPGVGKTTLVKALARSLDIGYSRIQFTPDLLPSDITGVSIFNQKEMEFEFKKGPIFSNIVLADEINRTSPKTQSALLEAMEEQQISDGNNTYKLHKPFMVLATQNPIDYEGTFVLPEAQLDRFIMKVKIGYPHRIEEIDILKAYKDVDPLEGLKPVASGEDIIRIQKRVREIEVSNSIYQYIVDLVSATRDNPNISLGASPRASLALLRIAQATALIEGRGYLIPEDVRNNVALVLSHRIILSPGGRAKGYDGVSILEETIRGVRAPRV